VAEAVDQHLSDRAPRGRSPERLCAAVQLWALLPLVLAPLACWKTSPLPTKEALVGWSAALVLGGWAVLRWRWGRARWISTPVDWPLAALGGLGILSVLLHRDAWPLRLRDLSLFILLIVYAKVLTALFCSARFRICAHRLLTGAIFIVAAIAVLMDQGVYFFVFQPVEVSTEQARHGVASTIGHNGSVASLMLAGIFYAFALWGQVGSRWGKDLVLVFQAAFLYVIVAARTVAVWLILPVLIALLVYFLLRRGADAAWRGRAWRIVAGTLFIVLVFAGVATWQAPDSDSTPLARLGRLKPGVLIQGTRLRLWRIGLEMIRDHPLGVGWSGFKILYPSAQGRYFETHPDSPLVPTSLHPDRAHCDVLQVAIELGWLGLGVAVWLMFGFGRWALAILRRKETEERVASVCILLAMLATVMHILVSFEFHVISSAVVFLFGYASLGALEGRRSCLGRSGIQSIAPLRRLAAGGIVGIAVLVQLLSVRGFQAEEFFRRGHRLRRVGYRLGRPQSRQAQQDLYQAASNDLAAAFFLAPYRGDFAYYAGWCDLESGRMLAAGRSWDSAIGVLNRALERFQSAEQTFQSPQLLRDRAEVLLLQGQIDRERGRLGQAGERFKASEKALKRAMWINPGNSEFPYLLGKLYNTTGETESALTTWREAAERLPDFIDGQILAEGQRFEAGGDFQQAWRMSQLAISLDPAHKAGLRMAYRTGRRLGPTEKRQTLRQIQDSLDPGGEPNYRFMLHCADLCYRLGDYEDAERRIDEIRTLLPRNAAALILKTLIMSETGRERQAIDLLEHHTSRIEKIHDGNWKLFPHLALMKTLHEGQASGEAFLLRLLDDPRFAEAPRYLEEIRALKRSPAESRTHARGE